MGSLDDLDGSKASGQTCPATLVLDLIAHKWTISIVHRLSRSTSPIRFRQLQREVGAITQKELTKRLRDLERAGLVDRTIYAEVPPRVEYRLTSLGSTLIPILDGLHDWALTHAEAVEQNRRQADQTAVP